MNFTISATYDRGIWLTYTNELVTSQIHRTL